MSDAVTNEMQKLIAEIAKHRRSYYVLDDPSISDDAYDSLVKKLEKLEVEHPELRQSNSPTNRIGEPVEGDFLAVPHATPMLSLQDAFSLEEVQAWLNRVSKLLPQIAPSFFIDLKMDGLACALIYEDGKLVRAVTRGDGQVGEDVTHNVRTIATVPLTIDHRPQTIEVRGEIVIYKADFEKLNAERVKQGLELFKNPRNTAAGSIRQLDPKLAASRPLRFHAYGLISTERPQTEAEVYDQLEDLGFIVNKQRQAVKDFQGIKKYVEGWTNKRQELPFKTDGLVIKVNETNIFEQLGVVGKAPRGAIAFKYPPEQATTRVKDIIISVGRTGTATPVAQLEPIMVDGSLVSNASLHNANEIARLDVRIGDMVIIHKAGDIIPKVVGVLKDLRDGTEKPFNMAKELQNHPLKFQRIEGEVAWRAIDLHDPMILKRALEHYASKSALDIEGLGEKNVELLIDQNLVKDIADIYLLKEADLLKLERFADLSASNLISSIQKAKNPTLPRFLIGLGIRHVGEQTAIDLATKFQSFEALSQANYDTLAEIDGVGEIVAHSIVEWFLGDQNQKLVTKLRELGVEPQRFEVSSGPLTGKSFVVTGKLESMSRDMAAQKVRELGGIFQSSVGKGTTYLVYGENLGESKRANAEKYGTKLLTEAEFLRLL